MSNVRFYPVLDTEHVRVIKPHVIICTDISPYGIDELREIEDAARICYRSATDSDYKDMDRTKNMVKRLITSGHTAMLEHSYLRVTFICSRACANELVRHRHCGFAQESTRYCNYSKDKFGNKITVIDNGYMDNPDGSMQDPLWLKSCEQSAATYFKLLGLGYKPEQARDVLPLCLATTITCSASYREWREIFKLRCDKAAHPEIRELMRDLCSKLKVRIPVIFDNISWEEQ